MYIGSARIRRSRVHTHRAPAGLATIAPALELGLGHCDLYWPHLEEPLYGRRQRRPGIYFYKDFVLKCTDEKEIAAFFVVVPSYYYYRGVEGWNFDRCMYFFYHVMTPGGGVGGAPVRASLLGTARARSRRRLRPHCCRRVCEWSVGGRLRARPSREMGANAECARTGKQITALLCERKVASYISLQIPYLRSFFVLSLEMYQCVSIVCLNLISRVRFFDFFCLPQGIPFAAKMHLDLSRKRGLGHDPTEAPRTACACWWAARPQGGDRGRSLALFPLSVKQFADDASWCLRYLLEPTSEACAERAHVVDHQWPTLHAILNPTNGATTTSSTALVTQQQQLSRAEEATVKARNYARNLARLCVALGASNKSTNNGPLNPVSTAPTKAGESSSSDNERFKRLFLAAVRPTAMDGSNVGEKFVRAALKRGGSSSGILGSQQTLWLGASTGKSSSSRKDGGLTMGDCDLGVLPDIIRLDIHTICTAEERAAPFLALVTSDPGGFSKHYKSHRSNLQGSHGDTSDVEAGSSKGDVGGVVSVDVMVDALINAVDAHRTQLPVPFRLGAKTIPARLTRKPGGNFICGNGSSWNDSASGGGSWLRAAWEVASLLAQNHPVLSFIHSEGERSIPLPQTGAVTALANATEGEGSSKSKTYEESALGAATPKDDRAATNESSAPARRVPIFLAGDCVTWRGADDDLPAGTIGVVQEVHLDGDVEVSFTVNSDKSSNKKSKRKSSSSSSCDGGTTSQLYTFSVERLEPVDAVAVAKRGVQELPPMAHEEEATGPFETTLQASSASGLLNTLNAKKPASTATGVAATAKMVPTYPRKLRLLAMLLHMLLLAAAVVLLREDGFLAAYLCDDLPSKGGSWKLSLCVWERRAVGGRSSSNDDSGVVDLPDHWLRVSGDALPLWWGLVLWGIQALALAMPLALMVEYLIDQVLAAPTSADESAGGSGGGGSSVGLGKNAEAAAAVAARVARLARVEQLRARTESSLAVLGWNAVAPVLNPILYPLVCLTSPLWHGGNACLAVLGLKGVSISDDEDGDVDDTQAGNPFKLLGFGAPSQVVTDNDEANEIANDEIEMVEAGNEEEDDDAMVLDSILASKPGSFFMADLTAAQAKRAKKAQRLTKAEAAEAAANKHGNVNNSNVESKAEPDDQKSDGENSEDGEAFDDLYSRGEQTRRKRAREKKKRALEQRKKAAAMAKASAKEAAIRRAEAARSQQVSKARGLLSKEVKHQRSVLMAQRQELAEAREQCRVEHAAAAAAAARPSSRNAGAMAAAGARLRSTGGLGHALRAVGMGDLAGYLGLAGGAGAGLEGGRFVGGGASDVTQAAQAMKEAHAIAAAAEASRARESRHLAAQKACWLADELNAWSALLTAFDQEHGFFVPQGDMVGAAGSGSGGGDEEEGASSNLLVAVPNARKLKNQCAYEIAAAALLLDDLAPPRTLRANGPLGEATAEAAVAAATYATSLVPGEGGNSSGASGSALFSREYEERDWEGASLGAKSAGAVARARFQVLWAQRRDISLSPHARRVLYATGQRLGGTTLVHTSCRGKKGCSLRVKRLAAFVLFALATASAAVLWLWLWGPDAPGSLEQESSDSSSSSNDDNKMPSWLDGLVGRSDDNDNFYDEEDAGVAPGVATAFLAWCLALACEWLLVAPLVSWLAVVWLPATVAPEVRAKHARLALPSPPVVDILQLADQGRGSRNNGHAACLPPSARENSAATAALVSSSGVAGKGNGGQHTNHASSLNPGDKAGGPDKLVSVTSFLAGLNHSSVDSSGLAVARKAHCARDSVCAWLNSLEAPAPVVPFPPPGFEGNHRTGEHSSSSNGAAFAHLPPSDYGLGGTFFAHRSVRLAAQRIACADASEASDTGRTLLLPGSPLVLTVDGLWPMLPVQNVKQSTSTFTSKNSSLVQRNFFPTTTGLGAKTGKQGGAKHSNSPLQLETVAARRLRWQQLGVRLSLGPGHLRHDPRAYLRGDASGGAARVARQHRRRRGGLLAGMQHSCTWALLCCGLCQSDNDDNDSDDDDNDDDDRNGNSRKASAHKGVRCVGPIGLVQLVVRTVVRLLGWLGRAWCGPSPTCLPWVTPPLTLELPDLPPPTPPAPYSSLVVFLGALPPAACDALLRFVSTVMLAVSAMASLEVFVWRASVLARMERRVNAWADAVVAFGETWWCEGVVETAGLPNQVLGVRISLGNPRDDDNGSNDSSSTVSPCATWFLIVLMLLLGPRLLRYVIWPLIRLLVLQPIQRLLTRLLRGPSPASLRAKEVRFQTAVAAAELAALANLGLPVDQLVDNGTTIRSSANASSSRLSERQSANATNDNEMHSERPVYLPFGADGDTGTEVTI